MFNILLRTKLRIAKNKIFSYRLHSRLKGVVIAGFISFYLFGGYFLLREGFAFVQGSLFVGDVLLDRVMELFFFVLFIMLLTSHAIFAYGACFRSKETLFLRTLPISASTLFAWEFWEATLLSSWTFLFVSIPMLIAYAQVRDIFFSFIGLFFLLFLPLVILCAVLGSLVALAIVWCWRSKWRWVGVGMAACAAIVFGIAAWMTRSPSVVQPMMHQILDKMLWHTQFARWPFWPSQWVSCSIMAFIKGDLNEGLSYLWFLWITALLLVQALLLRGGQLLQATAHWECARRWAPRGERLRLEWLQKILQPALGPDGAGLIVKDIKTFLRDPAQWSHFAIFFGLLGIYFLNLRNFHYEIMRPFWKNLVTFLNLATVGLVAGTLSTRFFFPLPSMEMRRRWIWGVGGDQKILWPKFVAGFVFLLGVTETLMAISCTMLELEGWITLVCMAADSLICVTMVGMSLGLGAAFPSPKDDLSAKIVSGFGGTLCLVLTLAYLGTVILTLSLPIELYLVRKLLTPGVFYLVMTCGAFFVVLLSIGLAGGSLLVGNRAMQTAEF